MLSHLHRNGPTAAGAVAAAVYERPQSLTRVYVDSSGTGSSADVVDEADGRQQVLARTDGGRVALAADMAGRDAWLAWALAGLTETEREVLRLAGQLLDRLADVSPDVTTTHGE